MISYVVSLVVVKYWCAFLNESVYHFNMNLSIFIYTITILDYYFYFNE